MRSSLLVIALMALGIVVALMVQLTYAYAASTNSSTAATPNGTTLTTTDASKITQYNWTQVSVLIIDNSGHIIASYLINNSKISIEGSIEHVSLLNSSLDYYVIAINAASRLLGYIKVPGSVLNEAIEGGNYTLYSWIISNIKLKPLNQYPKSSLSIIIKAPNGELIKGGTLCIHPIISGSPQCVETVNGIVRFSNLTTEPYLVFYGMRLLINVTANVYGYTINTTLITNLIGDWLLIPSNETVTVTPSIMTQYTFPSRYPLYMIAMPSVASTYTASIAVTATPSTLLAPLHRATVLSVSNIAVILMLIVAILGGVVALLTVPRTIRRTH